MPVRCQIEFPRIDDGEMAELDYRVMEHVFATQNGLGCLADEIVYKQELSRRLRIGGIRAGIEIPLSLTFRDFETALRLDLVVEDRAIYELKTVSAITDRHKSQLLEYLFLTDTTHGKLINFRPRRVESRFVNTTLKLSDRQSFTMDDSGFSGSSIFPSFVRELVEDRGTGLDRTHYPGLFTIGFRIAGWLGNFVFWRWSASWLRRAPFPPFAC